jgi:aryl-alcohol dehydrogenase-like predicted oxidoreductase
MGEALKALGWTRDSYIVSSKVFWGGSKPTQRGLSRKHVTDACHAALKRLQVDYLDLYFCHRPDIDTPIEETVRAMHDLIQQGKVLYWGTSEWNAQQITEAHRAAREWGLTPPTMEQPQYNIFERAKVEGDYAPLYDTVGLGHDDLVAAGLGPADGQVQRRHAERQPGDAAGLRMAARDVRKRRRKGQAGEGQANWPRSPMAGLPIHHMALLWCLANPRVSTVILGASRLTQLTDNLAALDNRAKMTPDVMDAIEAIVQNKPAAPQRGPKVKRKRVMRG